MAALLVGEAEAPVAVPLEVLLPEPEDEAGPEAELPCGEPSPFV